MNIKEIKERCTEFMTVLSILKCTAVAIHYFSLSILKDILKVYH